MARSSGKEDEAWGVARRRTKRCQAFKSNIIAFANEYVNKNCRAHALRLEEEGEKGKGEDWASVT